MKCELISKVLHKSYYLPRFLWISTQDCVVFWDLRKLYIYITYLFIFWSPLWCADRRFQSINVVNIELALICNINSRHAHYFVILLFPVECKYDKQKNQGSYDDFLYSKDRTRHNGDIYWQCRNRKTFIPFCTGRLYTLGKERVRIQTEHNHPTETSRSQKMETSWREVETPYYNPSDKLDFIRKIGYMF